MISGLAALPALVQICIIIGTLLATVIVAFLGKVSINVGKTRLNFGKSVKLVTKSRSCSDCRKLVMSRTMQFDQAVKMIKDDILRDQLNYADEKIHEVNYDLTASYMKDIITCREKDQPVDFSRESKEYLLYQETLGNAMNLVKDEIRRAFKENGFYEMSDCAFSDYIKGKCKLLVSVAREYVRSRYPFQGMMVPMEWRFGRLPEQQIESVCCDLFTRAKEIKKIAEQKIVELGEHYDLDIDELRKT
jgi:hypothetical protein